MVSSCLNCFLRGGELYLFEYGVSSALFLAKGRGGTCSLAAADPAEDVLHRAHYLLKNGDFGVYDLFANNCEDLTIYCKTGLLGLMMSTSIGVGISGQATSFLAAAGAAVLSSPLQFLDNMAASFAGLAAVMCLGMSCISRSVSDIGGSL